MSEKSFYALVGLLVLGGLTAIGIAFGPKWFGHKPSQLQTIAEPDSTTSDLPQGATGRVKAGPTAVPTNIPALPFWDDLKLWEKSKDDYEKRMKRTAVEVDKDRRECISTKPCRVFRAEIPGACGTAQYEIETDTHAQDIRRMTYRLERPTATCVRPPKSKVGAFIENQVVPRLAFVDDRGVATALWKSQDLRARIDASCAQGASLRDCFVTSWSQWVCQKDCPALDAGFKKARALEY